MSEFAPLAMFLCTFAVLLSGFPVAFCLAGTALGFAGLGIITGHFDAAFLSALPARIYGIMSNETLMAVPLFVFMGVVLERSKIAEDLLETMAQLCGSLGGGLGISVCLVGGLLAASTGIVGATVVTMGLISLPAMLKRAYSPAVSTGIICASGNARPDHPAQHCAGHPRRRGLLGVPTGSAQNGQFRPGLRVSR